MKRLSIIILLLLQDALLFSQSINEIESYKLNIDYAESLSNKADFFFSVSNYEKAILIIEEKKAIIEKLYGKDNVKYAICLLELAQYVANTGDYNKSVKLSIDALAIIEKKEGEKSTLYAFTSDKLSLYYSFLGDYEKALIYAQKACFLYQELYGIDNEWYVSSKGRLANAYTELSRNEDALIIHTEIVNYWKNKGDSLNYAISLHDMSLSHAAMRNFDKAIDLSEEASNILKRLHGESDRYYLESLKTLSDYYIEVGRFEKAYNTSEKQLVLYKKYYGEKSLEYIRALSNQAFYLSKGGNYKKAIELGNYALSIQQELGIVDSLDYAKILSSLAIYNMDIGYIDKAIDFNLQSLRILNNYKSTITYTNTLTNLASAYLQLGYFDKAIEINKNILDGINNKESAEYYGYLSNLANCFYMKNNYDDAIKIYELVLDYQGRLLGESNEDYAGTLENLASCYAGIYRLRDALRLQEKSLSIQKKILGNKNPKYAFSLINLGYIYRCMGDDVRSLEVQKEALIILKNDSSSGIRYIAALEQMFWNYIFKEPEYALNLAQETKDILNNYCQQTTLYHIYCLENLAYAYMYLGRYKEALDVFEIDIEAPNIKNYLLKNIDRYIAFLNKKSELFTKLKRYKESIEIEKKALEISKDLKESDLTHYDIYINLCMNYVLLNDIQSAANLMKEQDLLKDIRDQVYFNINSLTSDNRNSYWNKVSVLFTHILPIITIASQDSTLFSMTYDMSALFAKSILLREDLKLSNAIKNSSDYRLQAEFKNYQKNLAVFNKGDLNLISSDSLYRVIVDQEDELKQNVAKRNITSIAYVSWKDVQKCLKKDDIAIEFLSIKTDDGKEGYIALVIKKEFNTPHLYPLCFKEEIDSVLLEHQPLQGLYKLIWEPLKTEIENVNNIYFSPSGVLYSLGIEYLTDFDGVYLFERYNIYRLSSTQEILNSISLQNIKYNQAVLYGGLEYDIIPSTLFSENEKGFEAKKESNYNIQGGLRDSLNNRGSFEPLYGTAYEVKDIEIILRNNKIECKVYKGIHGTEESFKCLDDSIEILHIATHGMYIGIDQKEFASERNFNFIHSNNNNKALPEDIALTRSFIVMSGGDMLPNRYEIKKGIEDGILTAEEISRLDFHGLDLVVLSACQTALGDISNEGVLGLQRGFKKAGANTILMSLDKIDDEATRILMVAFYQNLMSGMSKHKSLKEAQKHLRQVENGKYDNPKYWASFILLDGLN